VAAKDDYLIDLLVDMGQVSNEQLAARAGGSRANGEGVVDTLLARKIIRPINVAQAKAAHFGYEFINLSELRLTDDVIAAVPRTSPSATGPCRWPSTTIPSPSRWRTLRTWT
jgi:hypothetical protein